MITHIILGILLLFIAFLAWMIFEMKKKLQADKGVEQQQFTNQLEILDKRFYESLMLVSKNISQTMSERMNGLQETFDRRISENTTKLDSRLDGAAKSYAEVRSIMTQVVEGNKRIFEVGKDISSLQEILRAPKIRGGLGEFFLGDLLGQIFPKENYAMQYCFKSGEIVDAVIKLKGGLISIDSKFPLENFKKMITDGNEEEKKKARKMFLADVKKHIDAISDKYIVPNEGTLDFALMYIPAENVYYESIIKEGEEGVLKYSFEKKVVPVSPNTLYVYVNTILLGLKGMQIEKHAQEIMNNLKRLTVEYERFRKDFSVVGKHINDSKNKYEIADKRLDKFTSQLAKTLEGEIELETEEEKISLEE